MNNVFKIPKCISLFFAVFIAAFFNAGFFAACFWMASLLLASLQLVSCLAISLLLLSGYNCFLYRKNNIFVKFGVKKFGTLHEFAFILAQGPC